MVPLAILGASPRMTKKGVPCLRARYLNAYGAKAAIHDFADAAGAFRGWPASAGYEGQAAHMARRSGYLAVIPWLADAPGSHENADARIANPPEGR